MNYRITDNQVEVYITNIDVENGVNLHNPYVNFPEEVRNFYLLNKDNEKFREVKYLGRTQKDDGTVTDGITYYFDLSNGDDKFKNSRLVFV